MAPLTPFLTVAITFAIVILLRNSVSTSLSGKHWCYGCHIKPGDYNCALNETLLGTNRSVQQWLLQNRTVEEAQRAAQYALLCDSHLQPYCVVEWMLGKGNYIFYYRDCSDGKIFSMENFPTLNTSAYVFHTDCSSLPDGNLFCVKLCKGDFCNGPRDETTASAPQRPMGTHLAFVTAVNYLTFLAWTF